MSGFKDVVLGAAADDAKDKALTAAVEGAIATIDDPPPADEDETPADTEPADSDTVEEIVSDLSESELVEAQNLYKALKDPTSRALVLRDLAQAAGITADSTSQDVRAAKKGIQTILDEVLGPEFKFLTPKLGAALEAVMESEREETREETAKTSQKVEAQIVQQQVDSALGKLSTETKGQSRKLEGRMVQLMNTFQAAPNVDVYTYLKGIYEMANAGRANKVATTQLTDRINRNSKDAPGRLASTAAAGGNNLNGIPPNKKMTLNQSIKWAMDQIEKK